MNAASGDNTVMYSVCGRLSVCHDFYKKILINKGNKRINVKNKCNEWHLHFIMMSRTSNKFFFIFGDFKLPPKFIWGPLF